MTPDQAHNCINDDKLIADIEKFGWTVLSIEASDYLPGFTYTVGLWKTFNHPELIAIGLSAKTLQSVLNIGGDLIKAGQTIKIDKVYDDFFGKNSTQFLTVDQKNIADYLGYAIGINERNDFPALQLVWTDRNNKFPWEGGFEEEFRRRQPLLDRNADFKFMEVKNLAIYTTRQWLDLRKPILRVLHDQDGEWQFLTGDQMPEDIRIVALEQMVLRDDTLNEVYNLDYGEEAERQSIGSPWKRSIIEYDDESE